MTTWSKTGRIPDDEKICGYGTKLILEYWATGTHKESVRPHGTRCEDCDKVCVSIEGFGPYHQTKEDEEQCWMMVRILKGART